MSFHMLIGGKDINEINNISNNMNEPNNKEEIDKQSKSNILMEGWNKCIYKSELMEYTVPGCCGKSPQKQIGYTCLKLGHLNLTPLTCSLCTFKKFEE